MMKKFLILIAVSIFLFLPAANSFAGKIVLANDEWTLSNTGYVHAPDASFFAENIGSWFTDGGSGDFLVYSENFGLTESSFSSTMIGAGHTMTVSTGITFDLPTLSTYDGIFLAGDVADNTVLTNYVNAGGNVYLAGGTGWGGAAAEANQWNTFLNNFGLGFEGSYNNISGSIAISNLHQIFDNVDSLYQGNGSSVLDIGNPFSQILVSLSSSGDGLYAVYDDGNQNPPIPEPATMLLFGLGLLGLAGVNRKKYEN